MEKLVACYRSAHPSTDIFLSTANLSLVKQKNNPVLKVFNAIAFKVWQHSSLLEGDLACLQQLQQKNSQWKFYLNIVRKSSEKTIQNVQLELDKKHIWTQNRATICFPRLAPSSPWWPTWIWFDAWRRLGGTRLDLWIPGFLPKRCDGDGNGEDDDGGG